MARRPFVPKPFEPGATVNWRHVTVHGSVEVEGVVVCGAPAVAGQRTMWVAPTTVGFTDVYSLVPVIRVAREGWRITWLFSDGRTVKGEFVSSNVNGTDTLAMMVFAWRRGEQVKTERAAEQQTWPVAA